MLPELLRKPVPILHDPLGVQVLFRVVVALDDQRKVWCSVDKRYDHPCIQRGGGFQLVDQFIAEEADKCLAVLVQNCQESKVLQILQMQNMNSDTTTIDSCAITNFQMEAIR